MSYPHLTEMWLSDAERRIEDLEAENAQLRAKLNNRKKLTPAEVQEIRRFLRTTGMTNQEIGDMYSVHRTTVARIADGTYHKSVY